MFLIQRFAFIRDFNPRSRKGSDQDAMWQLVALQAISIHAPARGATLRIILLTHCWADFNPRSRKGSDRMAATVKKISEDFNPRSRKGSDGRRSLRITCSSVHFNPRSRKGSDPGTAPRGVCSMYFNPRSRKGSDVVVGCRQVLPLEFQSTLPQGERRVNFTQWDCFG